MIDFDKPRSAQAQARAEARADETRRAALPDDAFGFEEIRLEGENGQATGALARRINDRVGAVLVAVVVLAAIPLASARPVFWMIWAAVLGLMLAVYMVTVALVDPARPINSLKLKAVLLPALAMPLFGLVQYLVGGPLALDDLPGGLRTPVGTLAPEATFMAVVRLFGLFALFVLVHEVSTRARRVTAMAWGLFAGVALHAVWALIALVFLDDVAFWGEKTAYLGVATGTFVNRNSFANFLGMGLGLGVALILARAARPHLRMPGGRTLLSERNLETAALWLVAGIILIAMLATQSRMGVVSGGIGALLVYFVMKLKRDHTVLAAATRTAVIALAGIVVGFGVFGRGLLERGLFTATEAVNRSEIYKQVIGMIAERPLAGTGLDTFQPAFEIAQQPPVSAALVWRLAHNSYLTLWSEMGLIVGTLPLIAVAVIAVKLVTIIRRRRTDYAVAAAGLGVIVQQALHATVDFSLEIQANLMLFIVILAMGLGRLRRKATR
ncbi:O-antigen ligase family protein [Maritimibacter fusiformis]|nr:O-antigen ligase family protein [Maritimibacter fusiformis]